MVRRRGFKILWLRLTNPKKNIFRLRIQNTLTYWYPWLEGRGSKYYGYDISTPPPPLKTFSGWGFGILLL
jgi:hypothetical protein